MQKKKRECDVVGQGQYDLQDFLCWLVL